MNLHSEGVTLADAEARRLAIDPRHSYIVQAPAGSGKTGLLTQRFLCLLAGVEQPEELIAITFTRKAAAEMQSRIVEALHSATEELPEQVDPYRQQSHALARQVLQRDAECNWRLLEQPGRLRILTMDALAAMLTRQLPILSRMGGRFQIGDESEQDYRQAARATLLAGRESGRWSEPIARLLDHMDNQLERVETLLARLLARRDQWLHWLGGARMAEARDSLQQVLAQVVVEGIQAVDRQLSRQQKEQLWQLTLYAGENMRQKQVECPLSRCLPDGEPPLCRLEDLDYWLALSDWLLSKEGEWRKQVDLRVGFPPASQGKSAAERARFGEKKQEALACLAALAEDTSLLESLRGLRMLPPAAYSEGQWEILSSLLLLLPMAVAQLRIRFQLTGQVDFAEVALRAEEALGDSEQPTPLAMKLDYQIRHLLVDEFQDTSLGQYRFIERLLAGWQNGDGRTLFVVGDPMQSIYRFREAEVGLFLRAQQQGIAQVALHPLRLTVNFRAQSSLVEWVNQSFCTLFPDADDVAEGAVSFHASVAFRAPLPGPAVQLHPSQNSAQEAEQVVELLKRAREKGQSTAILVRTRSHLQAVLPSLQQAAISYQGIDLAPLLHSMVIQDLLSLTRALLFPSDHIAWLALLRAPWCGLSLADLTRFLEWQPAGEGQRLATVWQRITMAADDLPLSSEGRMRLLRVANILLQAVAERRRCQAFPGIATLRFSVESCWQELGGPATLPSAAALQDARRYFALLAAQERGGDLADWSGFLRQVERLYAGVDEQADSSVAIMTIHKAKGLEFDTVIIPGLARMPRVEDRTLLSWQLLERGLLLGPLKRVDQEQEDPIQAYIRYLERKKSNHEAKRLLYVAVTRAKKELHLLGQAVEPGKKPSSRSFLGMLWPTVESAFGKESGASAVAASSAAPLSKAMRVLPSDWHNPPLPPAVQVQAVPWSIHEEAVEFAWAGEMVRLVGIVVHRFLHLIVREGINLWTTERINSKRVAIISHLSRLGLPDEQMERAVTMVREALLNTLQDERGCWILDDRLHQEARSEYALSGVIHDGVQHVVLDRTFIDRSGVRWIIDFKSSWHSGQDREAFFDNEQLRYQEQLSRYGMLLHTISAQPIRLGLYFPLHCGWRSWSYSG
ncbi:UvrD-helicase domain-containing protein [Candidatus Magnetaquicoccus inordinatus]|uniref:UvrD-helicase domain-containing protein n=1 Tax=Candidatus Magnetaquicoccus inordinatus TaxID=2496818 RepID=UPI00102C65CB|nr:UvrD-helicase domain-containing protein [Candidatus Magnetaquicoccus inordinatus]